MIAIEPVAIPVATFSAIRRLFETTDSIAAPDLVRVIASFANPKVFGERTCGTPPVADGVLLLRWQLGHRPAVLGAGVVGDEDRVVAEAATAARLANGRPLAAAFEEVLVAGRVDVGDDADVRNRAVLLGVELLEQEVQVLLVGGVMTGVACGAPPRAPSEPHRLDPGVIGDGRLAA